MLGPIDRGERILAQAAKQGDRQVTLTDVNQDELNIWSDRMYNKLKTLPQLADVASDQANAGRQLKLRIDRDAASRLGIDPATVDHTLYEHRTWLDRRHSGHVRPRHSLNMGPW